MVGQYLNCSLPKFPGLCTGADQNNIDIVVEENPAEEDERDEAVEDAPADREAAQQEIRV